ncbi:MAG: hypothetical protein U0R67_05025 [Micropruina glycogenica]
MRYTNTPANAWPSAASPHSRSLRRWLVQTGEADRVENSVRVERDFAAALKVWVAEPWPPAAGPW